MMDVAVVVSGEVSNTTAVMLSLLVGNGEEQVTIVYFLFDANVEKWSFLLK